MYVVGHGLLHQLPYFLGLWNSEAETVRCSQRRKDASIMLRSVGTVSNSIGTPDERSGAVRLPDARTQLGSRLGGKIRFHGLPDGTWIVREWYIRMPLLQAG